MIAELTGLLQPHLLMDNFKAMSNRIDNIKVINVVTETEEGIKTVNQIRDDADV